MTDRYEVVLLVDASGAVRAFQSVSGEAAKTAQSLGQVGSAGASGLGKVNQASTQTASNLGRVSTAADALGRAATGVAASALVGFLSDAAREAANAQAIQARLQTSVEATGKSYDDYAGSVANATKASMALGFDDEDTAAALATLTQQTGDAGKALDLLATAQDLARGKGIGLADAATIVGKVAAGNTAILQRYGIVVDKNASSTEALAQINQKFAGQSQAFADTTQGALDRAQVAWHNFDEEVGGAAGPMQTAIGLLPGLTSGFHLVSGAVGALSGTGGLAALLAAINPVTLAIGGAVVAGGLIIKTLADQQQAADGAAKSYTDLHTAIQSVGDAQARTTFQAAQLAPPPPQAITQARAQNAATGLLNQGDIQTTIPLTNVPSDQQVKAINDAVNQTIALANARDLSTEAVDRAAAGESKLSDAVRANSKSADDAIAILTDFNSIMNYDQEGADKLHEQALTLFDGFRAGTVTLDGLRDGMHHFADDERSMGQAMAGTGAQLATATNQYGALIKVNQDLADSAAKALDAISKLNSASVYQTRTGGVSPTAGFELSPSQQATNQAGLEQASNDRVAKDAQDRADAIVKADQAVEAAANKRVQTIQSDSQKEIDAVNKTADAQIKQAEQSSHAQSLAIKLTGLGQSREANAAAQDQIRAATLAQNQQTNAARRAADAQIAAAKDAADAQIQAAKDAADAQVQQAQRAEQQQVRSAQEAANAQIRAANAAAHDQVAAAQKAAHEQTAAADRLVTSVTADAKAQHDAVVQAAQDAHDQAVAQANKTADAEIAAAKRSADQQIIQLQRRTQAAQDNARDTANKALTQANDQAARAIKGGADPGKVAKQLEDAQKKAYADQEKAQENATSRQQSQQAKIQAQEQQRIDNINAYKEQATKAADAQLQAIQDQAQKTEDARVAAATKQAADMKKQAAQSVAQVQRATDQQTNDIARAANRSVEEAKRTAAKQTDAVKTASAQQEANAEKAIQANLQATTDAANKQAAQVATDTARNTARVKTDAERSVQKVQAETAHQQNALARQTDQITRQIDTARKKRIDDINTSVENQTKTILDDAHKQEAAFTEAGANADAATGKALALNNAVAKGADGQYHFILDDPSKVAIKTMQDAIGLFSPDHRLDLAAAARVTVNADFSPFNAAIANVAGKTVASVEVAVKPYGTPQHPASLPSPPLGPHALGGVIGAANGRIVTVGEAGPEQVILPVGSLVRPHPASAADPVRTEGVAIHIHGDVYGMDDFEGKVQRAAVDAFTRGYPSAHMARRRALGAA